MLTNRIRGGPRGLQALFHAGSLIGVTDGQLLERFARRDGEASETAFAALVERHTKTMIRVRLHAAFHRRRRPSPACLAPAWLAVAARPRRPQRDQGPAGQRRRPALPPSTSGGSGSCGEGSDWP